MNVTMMGAERDCHALRERFEQNDHVVTCVVSPASVALETLARADAAFVVIGAAAASTEDELRQILLAADVVGRAARRELVLVLCCALPLGGIDGVYRAVDRHASVRVHVCYVPRIGVVEHAPGERDASRIVVGADSDHARSVIAELYAPLVRDGASLFFMDAVSAEVARVALSAMREPSVIAPCDIAGLCERRGANTDRVRRAVAQHRRGRVGPHPAPGVLADSLLAAPQHAPA